MSSSTRCTIIIIIIITVNLFCVSIKSMVSCVSVTCDTHGSGGTSCSFILLRVCVCVCVCVCIFVKGKSITFFGGSA